MGIAKGWDPAAHAEWQAGRPQQAITLVLNRLGSLPIPSAELSLQAGYYLFLDNAYQPARHILETASKAHPEHLPLLLNLAVLYIRTKSPADARRTLEHYVALGGEDVAAADGLATACHRSGDDVASRMWGKRAIEQKTREAAALAPPLALGEPREGGASIIAFSLWGDNVRYLRGAIANARRAPIIYPGWTCRYYLDGSAPPDVTDALARLGCEIVMESGTPAARHRLSRRFLVADDPAVLRYMVRDCDSVINEREAAAVGQWTQSSKPFHVMHDWWTHTDPILAGMWGGTGGVLPPIAPLIANYRSRSMETPNWDQWFLRDCIWTSIREQTLVHDRLFESEGSQPFPGPTPEGNLHVGQDEYAVRRTLQAAELAEFAASVPSLGL